MGNKGENIGDGGGWSRRFGPTMPHICSRLRSESPKTWGQEFGGLGKDGDQRFPYLILLQFLDIAGDPRSHAFCLRHSLWPVLHSCLPLWHWKCHIDSPTLLYRR